MPVYMYRWVCRCAHVRKHLWLNLCVGIKVCGCTGVMGVWGYLCPEVVHTRGCGCTLCTYVCSHIAP